jgi:hypothetical protein
MSDHEMDKSGAMLGDSGCGAALLPFLDAPKKTLINAEIHRSVLAPRWQSSVWVINMNYCNQVPREPHAPTAQVLGAAGLQAPRSPALL